MLFHLKNKNQFMIEVLTKVHNNFKMNYFINISNLCEKKKSPNFVSVENVNSINKLMSISIYFCYRNLGI